MPPQIPLTITLKSHTATVYLLLPATTTFSSLKQSLHSALLSNTPHLPLSFPSEFTADSIVLGLPRDASGSGDPKKGFVRIDEGVYKAGRGTIGNAGIKDGSVLGFSILEEGKDGDGSNAEIVVMWADEEDGSQSQTQS